MLEPGQNVEVYHEHIKPLLKEIAEKLESFQMNLVFAVEFEPGSIGVISATQPIGSISINMAEVAAKCSGDVDKIIEFMIHSAKLHGHRSKYLSLLGVPKMPEVK